MRRGFGATGSSLALSAGLHLALLAVVAAVWVPPVQETLGVLIPVRLLPIASDRDTDPPPGPREPGQTDSPRTLPAAPARAPAEPRSRGETAAAADVAAARLTELGVDTAPSVLAVGPSDAAGPKVVASVGGQSAGGPADPGTGTGSDPAGAARSLAALGASDPLGAGTSTGSPGYRTNPKPEYPALARERGYEGLVLLRVRVLPDGKAGDVVVERSSGHAILDQAALQAVKAWLFVPATRNGIAVPSWVSVPVRFSLAS